MCLGWFFDFDEKSGFGSPDFCFLKQSLGILHSEHDFLFGQLISRKNAPVPLRHRNHRVLYRTQQTGCFLHRHWSTLFGGFEIVFQRHGHFEWSFCLSHFALKDMATQ